MIIRILYDIEHFHVAAAWRHIIVYGVNIHFKVLGAAWEIKTVIHAALFEGHKAIPVARSPSTPVLSIGVNVLIVKDVCVVRITRQLLIPPILALAFEVVVAKVAKGEESTAAEQEQVPFLGLHSKDLPRDFLTLKCQPFKWPYPKTLWPAPSLPLTAPGFLQRPSGYKTRALAGSVLLRACRLTATSFMRTSPKWGVRRLPQNPFESHWVMLCLWSLHTRHFYHTSSTYHRTTVLLHVTAGRSSLANTYPGIRSHVFLQGDWQVSEMRAAAPPDPPSLLVNTSLRFRAEAAALWPSPGKLRWRHDAPFSNAPAQRPSGLPRV